MFGWLRRKRRKLIEAVIDDFSRRVDNLIEKTTGSKPLGKVAGIIVLRFPANHKDEGEVGTTIIGQVCTTHAFAALGDALGVPVAAVGGHEPEQDERPGYAA